MRLSILLILMLMLASGCAKNEGAPSAPSAKSIAPYCQYVSSPATFASPVTVSGRALYQYRSMGNGSVSGDWVTFRLARAYSSGTTYSLKIDGVTFSSTGQLSAQQMLNDLKAQIAADATIAAKVTPTSGVSVTDASGAQALKLTLVNSSNVGPTYSEVTELFQDGGHHKPIRYAEVRVTNSSGQVVQCTETDGSGNFTFTIPSNTGSYTVNVTTRASNSHNSAYILNNPTDNNDYALTTSVSSTSNTSGLRIVAPATGTLLGGAFNIMDKILDAQNYLRAQTQNCNADYPDCVPFTVAPIVYVYWTPGLSPGVYYGISGGISFYTKGRSDSKPELYVLGGVNGNTEVADMDHFDDSVIIHEYAHFIEDQFGNPNSPGGSHNGNSIIDPRLAWGEGWANFFQAAVTGYPYYRDTYGHRDCTATPPCTGATFNEYLDPANGATYNDKPESGALGEGNFREFSVARLLWDVVKPGSSLKFSEIWTAFNGPTQGMKVVNDPFKSMGRFHAIQAAITGASNWSSLRSAEEQAGDLSVYATPLTTSGGCSPATISMSIRKSSSDDGSLAKSDQLRNNDFYAVYHPGGTFNASIAWGGGSTADLDLYVYKPKYTFGNSSYLAAKNDDESKISSGSASVSAPLAAGTYMVNVMAYTGLYPSTGTYNTSYTLTINGATACPAP